MKKIKKVEVTPIDRNIGKIVDSTGTVDDKTKNTYSMRVINQMAKDLTSETYQIKVRGLTNTGTIDTSTFVSGGITFKKRNGVVTVRFTIPPIQTYNSLVIYDANFIPFSIPSKFKAISGWYPDTLINSNLDNQGKLIQNSLKEGEIYVNDQVIFNGAYISLDDFSGQTVNGRCFFWKELMYMTENI